MARRRLSNLRKRAQNLGARAVDGFLASEERAEVLGTALRRFQEVRSRLDEQGNRLVGSLGLATQADLERVGRKIGFLRRRMLDLLDQLDDQQS